MRPWIPASVSPPTKINTTTHLLLPQLLSGHDRLLIQAMESLFEQDLGTAAYSGVKLQGIHTPLLCQEVQVDC